MKTQAKTQAKIPKVGRRLTPPETAEKMRAMREKAKKPKEREIAVTVWLTPEQHAFLSLRSYAMTGVNGGRAAKGMGLKGLCTGIVRDGVDRMMAAARKRERG